MTDPISDLEMHDLPEHLQALDEALPLLGTEVMSLTELDGLLSAVSASPEAIPTEEWLAMIWLGEEIDEEALAPDPRAAEVVAMILQRQMEIALELGRDDGLFNPIYDVDGNSGEILWELWIEGFERGLSLRPEAWEALCIRDEEAEAAFALLTTLIFIAEGDPDTKADLGPEKVEELTAVASELIPEAVEYLARAGRAGLRKPVRSTKIGRNDLCPCGSGKKHKKCCGAA